MNRTANAELHLTGRIDQSIAAGTIEEWTIVPTSSMDPPFQLHVWPMQIIEVGGQATTSPPGRMS